VFYLVRFAEAIYVLHAFEKKGQKTPKRDLKMGQRRYRDLMEVRRKERHGKG
jgi:phage-related protein